MASMASLQRGILAEFMTKLFDQNTAMSASFHSTPAKYAMLSTVIESECRSVATSNQSTKCSGDANANEVTEHHENVNVEPIEDQIASISSTNELHLDPVRLDLDVPVKFVDKKVLIEVNESPEFEKLNENSINLDLIDPDEDDTMCDGSSIYTVQPSTPQPASEPINNDEIVGNIVKLFPQADSSVGVGLMRSPPHMKYITDEKVRTPIGKLVIRKVTHSTQFENTQYAVEVVHKFQRPQAQRIFETSSPLYDDHCALSMETSPQSANNDNDATNKETPDRAHPELRSKRAFSRSPDLLPKYPRVILYRNGTPQEHEGHYGPAKQSKTIHHTPTNRKKPRTRQSRMKKGSGDSTQFPRIVLHRIRTLQEHQTQISDQTACTPNRKKHHTKQSRLNDTEKSAKTPFEPTKPSDLSSRVLEILNTGNEKSLQKLVTIGAKKASQIFNYRTAKGRFRSLDGLLEMPFWSKKTHERFIINNVFV